MLKTIGDKTSQLDSDCFNSLVVHRQYLSSDMDLSLALRTRHAASLFERQVAANRDYDRILTDSTLWYLRCWGTEKS